MSTIHPSIQQVADSRDDEPLVSVVIPCLNEEGNIEHCVRVARSVLGARISGEVIVVDNDSEDRSAELAAAAGARVVTSPAAATAAPTSPASPPRAGATS